MTWRTPDMDELAVDDVSWPALLDLCTSGRCETCWEPALGGGRWCWTHFKLRFSRPAEVEYAELRREYQRDRKRAERARKKAAA